MMRQFRIRSSLIAVGLLFLLSACGKQESRPPTVSGFRCHTVITCDALTAEGELTRETAGMLTLELTQPETLRGMQLRWDGETATVKLHGLSFGVDPEALPASGFGKALLSSLDAATGSVPGTYDDEGRCRTAGHGASGDFTLTSDPETGYLLSLTIPSLHLTATFSSFELLT